MNGAEFAAAINALAIAISKDKTQEQLIILGAVFTQLGDTVTTIATQNSILESNNN